MGSDTGKAVFGLDAGVAGTGTYTVDVARMPGQRNINAVEDMVTGIDVYKRQQPYLF